MKLTKKMISAILFAVMSMTSMVGCSPKSDDGDNVSTSAPTPDSDTEITAESKELALYLAGFQNLDPQIWTWGTHVDRMGIFEGLMKIDANLNARLANAESLEHNEDYMVWTAKLREDLVWSDGTPITADDYMYSFERVIDPQYITLAGKTSAWINNPGILNADKIRTGDAVWADIGIKKLDQYTIEFTLVRSKADFDVSLAESWALPVPKHIIEAKGDEWTAMSNIVSNGPYVPIERYEDSQLVLGSNEYYYGTSNFDKITIYMGTQNQLLAFQNGDINIADITAETIDAVKNDPELSSQMQIFESGVVSYLNPLRSSNDVLSLNPKIRQAISLSIDRETLSTDINKGITTPAYSSVSPSFASWGNDVGLGGYDPERAKALMEEAGYPNGEGMEPMTLLVAGNSVGADVLALAEMIERGTGIKVNILNEEWAIYVKDRDGFHDNDGIYGFAYDSWGTSVPGAAGFFVDIANPYGRFDIRFGNLTGDELKEYVRLTDDSTLEASEKNALRIELVANGANETGNQYWDLVIAAQNMIDPAEQDAAFKEAAIIREQDASFIPVVWINGVKLISSDIKGYVGNPLLLGTPPMYFNDIDIE